MFEGDSMEKPNLWHYEELLNRLILLVTKDELPASPEALPATINLGRWAKTANEMMQRTIADPQKRERVRPIKSIITKDDWDRPVISLDEEDTVGTQREATFDGRSEQEIQWRKHGSLFIPVEKNTILVGSIHTHSEEQPFSPHDLMNLLHDFEQHYYGISILATEQLLMALIRTQKTPQIDRVLRAIMTQADNITLSLATPYYKHPSLAQFDYVRQRCQDANIALYSTADKRSNLVKKVSA